MSCVTREDWLNEIRAEIVRAEKHEEEFHSAHEAYGVIMEEVDEFWELVKLKKRDREAHRLAEELVQIAAMALKGLESIPNFVGGKV